MEDIRRAITAIPWENYDTLRGNAKMDEAGDSVETLLLDVFLADEATALQATDKLWDKLCHQAQVASAALPAYDILLWGVHFLSDGLKVELLDILYNMIGGILPNDLSCSWKRALRAKFKRDEAFFEALLAHDNEDIAAFAELILMQM